MGGSFTSAKLVSHEERTGPLTFRTGSSYNVDMKTFYLADIADYPGFPFRIERGWLTTGFEVHSHDFSELTIILKGSASHEIDGNTYAVQAGDVYVLQGETAHGFSEVRDLEFYNMMFPVDALRDTVIPGFWPIGQEVRGMSGFQALFVLEPYYRKEHRFLNRLRLNAGQLGEIDALMRGMLQEYKTGNEGFRSMLQAGFLSVLIRMSRWMGMPEELRTGNLRQMAEAVAWMESDFTEPITLTDLADRACLSERHFTRVFLANYRMPPMEYLQRLRLRHACDLLRTRDVTVTRVAQDCGWRDGNLFSRQFRLRYGMTPTSFRKLYG